MSETTQIQQPGFPTVSIIMPAFNAEKYIELAVQSVIAQSYPNWELIIVNDHSLDNTKVIIMGFEDPRIHCNTPPLPLRKPSAARNYGSRHAKGEYLFFFDADDLLAEDAIESLLYYMHQNRGTSMAYGFLTHIDSNGRPLPSAGFKLVPRGNGTFELPSSYTHTWQRIASFKFVASINFMIRKSEFEELSGFDETLDAAEDIHLYLKVFLKSSNAVGILPKYIIEYRQHKSSMTKDPEKTESLLNAHLKVTEWFFSQENIPVVCLALKPFTICKAYNYVAGVRLAQGDQIGALRLLLHASADHRSTLMSWFKVCLTTLLRCLLPAAIDAHLKSFAVQLRDGVLLAWMTKDFKNFLHLKGRLT